MSDKSKAFINIENVVASVTLKHRIDLNASVRIFPGARRKFKFDSFLSGPRRKKSWASKKQGITIGYHLFFQCLSLGCLRKYLRIHL